MLITRSIVTTDNQTGKLGHDSHVHLVRLVFRSAFVLKSSVFVSISQGAVAVKLLKS